MRKFQLCGFINMFGIIPDFVYPVYLADGEYYLSNGDKNKIDSFIKIKEEYKKEVELLPEWYQQIRKKPGSAQIYIYQYGYSDVYVGSGWELSKDLKNIEVENEILKKDLKKFLDNFEEENEQVQSYYSTGRRKKAVARVYISLGNGEITINNRSLDNYFGMEYHRQIVTAPLKLTGTENTVNIFIRVKGGGTSGQANAIRHGISRALVQLDIKNHKVIKKAGFLTRDPRMKERKKFGLKGARKSPQTSKR